MSGNRKRKYALLTEPSEDDVNEIIKKHSESFHEEQAARNEQTSEEENEELTRDCSNHPLLTDFRVFNDPVHGHFEIPKLLFAIIDTPQFQRLREIKQLGSCYHVFPGACHNRFEHSLGVSYLAGCMCTTLRRKQPELHITQVDTICVQIAGLCHDLGHGPLSHFFDALFIPRVNPDSSWCHEDASVEMFDHMIHENNLSPVFKSVGLNRIDILFIKELIAGHRKKNENSQEWQYHGRPQSKSYLYEIVANKRTGIDVDKWDYFARDCYYLGISNNFDYKRFMKFARVVQVDEKFQICTRDKEVSTLYDMFHTRNSLHRRAYQHKTAKIIDTMLCEVLLRANDHVKIPGSKGNLYKISECITDMKAYTHLTDTVFKLIELSTDKRLDMAKQILHRVMTRDLYKLIGQTILVNRVDKKQTLKLCIDILTVENNNTPLNVDDFVVHIIEFDYGMKDENPIDQVRFYDKNNPSKPIKVKKNQVSQMLPETFAEQQLRFYCTKNNESLISEAKKLFDIWCNKMTCSTIDTDSPELSLCS